MQIHRSTGTQGWGWVLPRLAVLTLTAGLALVSCGSSEPQEIDVVAHDFTPAPTTSTTTTAPPPPPTTTTTHHYHPPATSEIQILASEPVERWPAGSVWDDLADCEGGNGVPGSGTANWSINTGNGYYGGLQFALSSWRSVGGTGYPHEHSREEQIYRAEKLRATPPGWGHWPACSRRMGLR
jgi:hypothetical protein